MIKKILSACFGKLYYNVACTYRQIRTFLCSIIKPYQYKEERYQNSFLKNSCFIKERELLNEKVDRVIYIFWTGHNEITPNRLKGIESLKKNSGVRVQLITPNNLNDYIVKDDPLPEAYNYLSLVHKADYLRTYFMYHYGGGYADIKLYKHSWIEAFEQLENSDAYAIGYKEVGWWGAANQTVKEKTLKKDLEIYWRYLIGNGAYICRPYTTFTKEWYAETKKRILEKAVCLKENSAHDDDPFNTNENYPIEWSYLLGGVFHPLCLKYHKRLLSNNKIKPQFKDYR